MQAQLTFTAMGTTCRVVVSGPARLASVARQRVDDLESRWSRFRPDSELSRLNAAGHLAVSPETRDLVRRSIAATRLTGGAFDASVLTAVEGVGYTISFAPGALDRLAPAAAPRPAPGCEGIEIDDATGIVALPPGVRLDPGGIGKGLAADLVTDEIMHASARGVVVDLGGDIRARGIDDEGRPWAVGIPDPADADRDLVTLALTEGAVATSTTLRRRWERAGRTQHHLIDPRTGTPTRTDVATVTVVAGAGWWAEAETKAVMVLGVRDGFAALRGADAVAVDVDGEVHMTPGLSRAPAEVGAA